MFEIVKKGLLHNLPRLVSDDVLSVADFTAIGEAVGERPVPAKKVGFVAARQATSAEVVKTLWEGEETSNTARAGDWIVTNMSVREQVLRDHEGNANTYVISASRFLELYVLTGSKCSFGAIYRAKGEVQSVYLAAGFDILAPWGERQEAGSGYLLLNGDDVYGNQTETFRATYSVD